MIRQTTTVPVVTPPEAGEPPPGRGRWWFVLIEVLLLGSIPVLGFLGFQSLLSTRSGEFAVEPGPDDAGWVAAVQPSPLSLMVDVDVGGVGGAVLLAPFGDTVDGGTVILISGATVIDGQPLAERTPAEVARTLEAELRLAIGEPVIADSATWDTLLAGSSIELANPDPVVELSGSAEVVAEPDGEPAILVPAGRVTVASSDLAALSTRQTLGSSDLEALEFRRSVLWNALLADPGLFDGEVDGAEALVEVAQHLQQIAAGVNRVELLPLDGDQIDAELTEALVRSSVALPLGHEVGARLQVRIIDRSGQNDLEVAAENLGRAGFEVVQIANAFVFDEGSTQVLTTPTGNEEEIARLAELTGAATVPPSLDAEATSIVTLLLGIDAPIAQSAE